MDSCDGGSRSTQYDGFGLVYYLNAYHSGLFCRRLE